MNWFKKLKTWKKIGLIGIIAVAIVVGTNDGGGESKSSSTKSTNTYESSYDSKCKQCQNEYNYADGFVIDSDGQIYASKQYGGNGGAYCSYDCAFLKKTERGY